jgi:RNA polymerase sigma-70 factor (ECF subfamily)
VEVLRWRQSRARGRAVLSEKALENLADAAAALEEATSDWSILLPGCLRALPERVRGVLVMKYADDLPIKEIAGRTGRQVGAVEMTLVRARRALRECLERRMRQSGHPEGHGKASNA